MYTKRLPFEKNFFGQWRFSILTVLAIAIIIIVYVIYIKGKVDLPEARMAESDIASALQNIDHKYKKMPEVLDCTARVLYGSELSNKGLKTFLAREEKTELPEEDLALIRGRNPLLKQQVSVCNALSPKPAHFNIFPK